MSVIDEESIKNIVIHCSATPDGIDFSAEDINRWHKERGWSEIGYHFVIRRDGRIEVGRDLDERGAHVGGHNSGSWGVCLIGGPEEGEGNLRENDFTVSQWRALVDTIIFLKRLAPNAEVKGHRDFPGVNKECPCFDVQTFLEEYSLL